MDGPEPAPIGELITARQTTIGIFMVLIVVGLIGSLMMFAGYMERTSEVKALLAEVKDLKENQAQRTVQLEERAARLEQQIALMTRQIKAGPLERGGAFEIVRNERGRP